MQEARNRMLLSVA